MSADEAKKWFDIESKKWGTNARTQKMPYNYDKEIIWPEAATLKMDDGSEIVVVSLGSNNAPTAVLRQNKKGKEIDKTWTGIKSNAVIR